MQILKRPFIWLSRFRCRCGYGVHSPFAFNFITNVIYEKIPYYAYAEIDRVGTMGQGSGKLPRKVQRLLFRLVNFLQPDVVVEAGDFSAPLPCLDLARVGIEFVLLTDSSRLNLPADISIDFLYIKNKPKETGFAQMAFDACVPYTHTASVMVVEGIHASRCAKRMWKTIQEDERTGISFDLYDVGIVFFDKTKIKQHYRVNF